MANKTTSEKNKPARKTLRSNEYYNPKTKRYEYHYKDCFGKERVISSYRLEMTDQLPNRKKLAHNTKVGYNVTVNTLKQYKLGYMEIGKIRPEHCEEWLTDMKKKYRGSSIQTQISLLKRTFEYAID